MEVVRVVISVDMMIIGLEFGVPRKKDTNYVGSIFFSYGSTISPVPFSISVANPLFDSLHNQSHQF